MKINNMSSTLSNKRKSNSTVEEYNNWYNNRYAADQSNYSEKYNKTMLSYKSTQKLGRTVGAYPMGFNKSVRAFRKVGMPRIEVDPIEKYKSY